jgi:hypothetical protein
MSNLTSIAVGELSEDDFFNKTIFNYLDRVFKEKEERIINELVYSYTQADFDKIMKSVTEIAVARSILLDLKSTIEQDQRV